ncbi:DNA-binding protein [Megasphaera hutchinsoni]|jgi:hypothetical protein|uniref:DNA-binding protein n=1 Tax=Megasphaera hutchinsoni TaxID=1588748 RepID=A0A2J8BC36_9FIRM|nr:helix-turn-helix transcriptional regulator [Megasphaera genomosp. type_2]PNH22344.1 DNA-binding protein [Megasphaera genomosp. type_2]
MTIGQQIKFYRKQKGLTQQELGAMFGMSKQAVYAWESELYTPDISLLLKLADFFQIPICKLLGRPGIYCQEKHTDSQYDDCTFLSPQDHRILQALHYLSPEEQHAVEILLHISPAMPKQKKSL